jgi:flotillin
MDPLTTVILISLAGIFVFGLILAILKRYKRCPSDQILVVYGKIGKGQEKFTRSSKCIHGGAAFIWPVFQSFMYLDLTPMSIEVNLKSALSKQNIRVDVPSRFTVGISTEEGVMQNAAERLLGLNLNVIQELAKDIIFGQLRLVVATMDIEEINTDRDKFLANVSMNVEAELKKIGLKLINVNVTDIMDESGYIEALGKEAAAKAINDAKKTVAEKNKDGSIGEANAVRDQRISVAKANANAVEGENLSKVQIADSDAIRREKEAEAERKAIAAEKVQRAMALNEAYKAEEEAEKTRARREMATKEADVIVDAEIDKNKIQIDAEAQAEQNRRIAKGEADAIFLKMEAQAKGINEILTKQADGYRKLVEASGGASEDAIRYLIANKLEEIIKLQTEAIKDIKIDKVTVWDSGGKGDSGKNSTAGFISGLFQSLPPLEELYGMAGLKLPKYLGEKAEEPEKVSGEETDKEG